MRSEPGVTDGRAALCSPQHPLLKYPGWSADDALWDRGDGRSACVGSALSERRCGPYLARHARDRIARRLSRGKPQGAPGRSRSALHSAPQWSTGRQHVPAPSWWNRRRVVPVPCPCGAGGLLGAGFVVWAPACVGGESEEPAPGQEKWRSVGGGDERRRRGTGAGAVPVRWPCRSRGARRRSLGRASTQLLGSARPTRRRFRGVGSNMCWRRVRGTGAGSGEVALSG